jgi:hypothetical protein
MSHLACEFTGLKDKATAEKGATKKVWLKQWFVKMICSIVHEKNKIPTESVLHATCVEEHTAILFLGSLFMSVCKI